MRFHTQKLCIPLFSLALFAAGCSGSDGANGADGSNGSNGSNGADGTSGNNGAVSLIRLTGLPPGDANCGAGGTQVDSGLDNGDGGGTANDGVLQSGEVDATERLCNNTRISRVGSFTAPAGAPGTFSMLTRGGDATATGGTGGSGGYVQVEFDFGSNGGHLKLFRTGQVDASFALPTLPATSNFGPTPLTVSSTTRVRRVLNLTDTNDIDGAALVAGDIVQPYNFGCVTYPLSRWNSAASSEEITGVRVLQGATLSFDSTIGGCTLHSVTVDYAVRNEGTITAGREATTGTSDSVSLNVGSYIGAAGSAVTLTGANQATGTGGGGGAFRVEANRQGGEVGSVWNFGTIDTSGGNGESGGNSGSVYVFGSSQVVNTGAVTARGGDATLAAGTGGSSSGVQLDAGYGHNHNSGTIDTRGGNGGTNAGSGGYVYLYVNEYGDLRNSGTIRTTGGTPAAGCAAACRGGTGGEVYIQASGDVISSASITTAGGDGLTGNGGNGGYIYFYTDTSNSTLVAGDTNAMNGSIAVSGNLDSHGGNGALAGGSGGYIYAEAYLDNAPFGQEVAFYGYGGGITTRGGNGDVSGGSGGYVYLQQARGDDNDSNDTPGGSVLNDLDINTRGGDAANGSGGSGGYFWAVTEEERQGSFGFERVINRGNIVTSGGDGTTQGGSSGYAFLLALDKLENFGSIVANSGRATAAAGNGGNCDTYQYSNEGPRGITLASEGAEAINTGALSNLGGQSTGAGGNGGSSGGILVVGYFGTINSGALASDGGDADTATGAGGDGGNVTIRSISGYSANSGALSATGGTGPAAATGSAGVISIDGQIQ